MTDNIDKPQVGSADKPQVGNDVQPQAGSETNSGGMTLEQALAKISELNRENAGHRTAKKAAETAAQETERQRLKDNEKWKELYEVAEGDLKKLQPIAEQGAAIEAAFNASLDNRLKLIPDDIRKELVDPVRKGMNPVEFSDWLDRNGPRLQARQAPPLDGGAGGARTNGDAVTVTPQAKVASDVAKSYGYNIDPAAVAARAKQIADSRARTPGQERDTDKEKE